MSSLLRAIGKDYLRSAIITLISAAIAIPLMCVLVFIPIALANQMEDPTTALWVMIIPAGCFLLILFGGGLGTIAFVFLRRARRFDAIFTPLGLSGRMYMLSGRQYHGTVQGQQVDVYFYRGPTLDLRVRTPLQTRLSVANSDTVSLGLARAFGRQPLPLADPNLSGLTVFTQDEDWTRSLLADPEAKALLRQLILSESSFLMRQVHLQPGTLSLRLYRIKGMFRFEITPGEARQWLNALLSLARIAESLPVPQG